MENAQETKENACCSQPKHQEVIPRLKKIEGQIGGIVKMIEQDRYCIDILMQLKAVKSALFRAEENILKKHIETCVFEAAKSGSEEDKKEKIEEIMTILSKYK